MKTTQIIIAISALGGSLAAARPARGQSWTQTSAPSNSWSAVAMSADGTRITAVTQGNVLDGQIYLSADAGVTWLPAATPPARWDSIASSADGMRLVASGYPGTYTSSDFGTTWVWRTNLSFQSLAGSADGTKLVGASGFNIHTSTDSGASWSLSSGIGSCVASSADGIKLVTAYFAYPGFLLGGIFISTNAGLTWLETSVPLDLSTGWNSLASSADGTRLFATIGYTSWPTGPGSIYASLNGGLTWAPSASPILHWNSIACSSYGTKLVAAGDGMVFTSADSGENWAWITNVPPSLRTSVASSADGHKLVAVLNGGGIWTWQAPVPPSLAEELENLIQLVENSGLPANRQHPLLASLSAAAASLQRDHINAAIHQLHAFENKVRAQVARSNPALAQELVQAAEAISEQAGKATSE